MGNDRPNVLLILTDDQGWDDLALHGNTYLETPRLDALGRESVQFANYYVAAVCAPTRASLLTGRHFLRTGVSHVHGGKDFVHPGEPMIAELFRDAGYRTGMWGKWHSGKTTGYFPWERGFDEAYVAQLYKHRDSRGRLNGEPREHDGWTVDTLTDYALNFIRRNCDRNRDRPFFAFLPYLTVHAPLVAPDELTAHYEAKGLSRALATTYAMLHQMDRNVGRLLDCLEDLGLADDTVVLFMSDNGPAVSYGAYTDADRETRYVNGYKGHKGNMWENGIKSPLFVRWGDRFEPHTVGRLCDVCDVLPTLLDLCGIDAPPELPQLDGQSVRPYLEGDEEALPPRESFIWVDPGWQPHRHGPSEYCHAHATEYDPVPPERKAVLPFVPQAVGLRTEDYKLMRNPGRVKNAPDAEEGQVLIHIAEDPREDRNVVGDRSEVAARMEKRLYAWFAGIREEPHAFHTPTFALGAGTSNVVYLYAPLRTHGTVHNAALRSDQWVVAGDGADYAIEVRQAGAYELSLQCREHRGEPVPLRLSVGEAELRAEVGAPTAELGRIDLSEGRHTLRLRFAGAAEGALQGMTALRFAPAD
ncbi:MAG: sulfatase-like hydrolase/transferase [Planctomycetota bacterium]